MSDYQTDGEWEEQGEEIEIEAIGIDVSSQPIELYKVFKIANLVGGGGEAKHLISEGYVAVNGELETRKRRKMYDGDFFEFNQEYYVVVCDAPVTEPQESKPKVENSSRSGSRSTDKHKAKNEKSSANKKAAEAKQSNKQKKSKKGSDLLSAKAEPREGVSSKNNKGVKSNQNQSGEATNSNKDTTSQGRDQNGRSSIAFF